MIVHFVNEFSCCNFFFNDSICSLLTLRNDFTTARIGRTVKSNMSFHSHKKVLVSNEWSCKHLDQMRLCALSPDGKTLAFECNYNIVQLLNVETGEEMQILKDHIKIASDIKFSPNGERIACCYGKNIYIWNIRTGNLIQVFEEHSFLFHCLVFLPDNDTIASGSLCGTVQLWCVETGELLRVFREHTKLVRCVAVSSNGKTLASCGNDKTVRLCDLKTGKSICVLRGHTAWVSSVAFSPDGKTLVSCSFDKSVQTWNVQTGEALQKFQGHTTIVYSVAFLPNGKNILSASFDETVRLWNTKTNESMQLLQRGNNISNMLNSFPISRDGNRLFSSLHYDLLQLYNFLTPVQRLLQKYIVLLCKCRHLSSATILVIFKSILNQKGAFTIVSDDTILQFIDTLKQL